MKIDRIIICHVIENITQPRNILLCKVVNIDSFIYNFTKYNNICNIIKQEYIETYHLYVLFFGNLYNHPEISKWIFLNFKIYKHRILSHINDIIAFGRLDTIILLHSMFNFTKKDIVSQKFEIFNYACYESKLDICKWLYRTFDLTKEDITKNDNYLFYKIALYGKLEILEWLLNTFDIPKNHILSIYYNYDKKAEIIKLLNNYYDLTEDEILNISFVYYYRLKV